MLPSLKNLSKSEWPQEKLEAQGVSALSDPELLALVLRSGTRNRDVLSVAASLIGEALSWRNLIRWRREDFQKIKGIGRTKANQLLVVTEIARRIMNEEYSLPPKLQSPETVFNYFKSRALDLEVEKVWALYFDSKQSLLRDLEIFSGTATSSLLHPREVFREAVRLSASGVLLVHNHPSGNPTPSDSDIKVTRQLREAASVLGISFLDHIVVGTTKQDPWGKGFYSFLENGLLK